MSEIPFASHEKSGAERIYTPVDLFDRALAAIGEMRAGGALRLLVNGPVGRSRIQFEVSRQASQPILESHGVSSEDLEQAIADLEDVLLAMVAGGATVEQFGAVRSDSERWTTASARTKP